MTSSGTVTGANLATSGRLTAGKMYAGTLNYNSSTGVYGNSYLGFNMNYDMSSSTWTVLGDGAKCGGVALVGTIDGTLYVTSKVDVTTSYSETVSDSTMMGNSSIKITSDGTLYAKAIEVTASGWPDYVFRPGYKLASLPEVEEYVKENSHLPGVPSASEVAKGMDLAKMNAALLEKIEELYLHSIEQEKRIEELERNIKK